MSLSRSEQARLNGAKSRGPKTEAGKARSAMNAATHGLCAGSLVVIDTEDADGFKELQQAFLDTFRPQNAVERECVIQAAVARWRLRRVWSLETTTFNNRMRSQEERWTNQYGDLSGTDREGYAYQGVADSISLLNRYERSISREYERALKNLDRARAESKYEPPAVESENVQPEQGPPVPKPEIEERRNEPRPVPETPAPPPVNTAADEKNGPLPRAA
jgi:hypothetical protein